MKIKALPCEIVLIKKSGNLLPDFLIIETKLF
ncbi:hypothetical protein HMPREF1528_02020 [Capnocytophaga sp. oral taxon 336 str. F0502]|nr:hypothetical protein HMPREF1528_02020 [Capnocytophaga sp. oral taxon 336 str. F0502]